MSQKWEGNPLSQHQSLKQMKEADAALNQDQIASDIDKFLTSRRGSLGGKHNSHQRQPVAANDDEDEVGGDLDEIYGTKSNSFYVKKTANNVNPLASPAAMNAAVTHYIHQHQQSPPSPPTAGQDMAPETADRFVLCSVITCLIFK